MNAIMNNFKDFCNEISDIVEERIISWHGNKKISHNQAIKLIRHGYMLGGLEIDYSSILWSMHYVNVTTNLFYRAQRFYFPNNYECFLERDENTLKDFYAVFKCQYDNYKSKRELDKLKIHIAEALWDNTMHNSLTYVFGG